MAVFGGCSHSYQKRRHLIAHEDELPDASGDKWTCSCAWAQQENKSYAISSNCSTSCDCSPEDAGGDRWTCLCPAERFSKTAGLHNTSCFAACNCTSGFPVQTNHSSKHISSKVALYILLICVLLTIFAFFASLACYIHKKRKCSLQPPQFTSDKDTSCNTTANLISRRSNSLSEFTVTLNGPLSSCQGCVQGAPFTFINQKGTITETIHEFTYSELEQATNKFSSVNLIGYGGSSQVYCGQLKDGTTVAVKRLKTHGGRNSDSAFLTEIELISRLNHCHVVPLLGYCLESRGELAEKLLVFEYMSNGNLRDCLDGRGKGLLDWGTRVSIAFGSARGLEYLHEAAAPRILHRDVKSTNILLDEKFRAKITDLGMAKRLRSDDLASCSNSPARMEGTFGYFAPEYAVIGKACLKSDVFSFGVVLLELISGRHPIHKVSNKGDESLVIWAIPRLQDITRVISELPDPLLKGNFPEDEMQIMAYVAKECLLLDPDSRPTMSEVVQILSTIAPEMSRRRNFPLNPFQRLSSQSTENMVEIEMAKEQDDEPTDAESLRRITSARWSAWCSLQNNLDRTIYAEDHRKELDIAMLDARSWHTPDDETLDLTEPQFQSFHMASIQSPGNLNPF